jgi:hypothetical protein
LYEFELNPHWLIFGMYVCNVSLLVTQFCLSKSCFFYLIFYSDIIFSKPVIEGRPPNPRDLYKYPQDAFLQANLTLMNDYLKETELKELFDSLLKVLLSRPDLPYNPYPGFVRRFRVQAEKFHLYEKTHGAIMEILCKY